MNRRYIPQLYTIIEKWVPDRSVRAALLLDIKESDASKHNKPFRETIDSLITEHDHRRPEPPKPVDPELPPVKKFCTECKQWHFVPKEQLVCPTCRQKALFEA